MRRSVVACVAMLLSTIVAGAGPQGGKETIAVRAKSVLELLIPLYIHPTDTEAWSAIAAAARRAPITVVINPASGPGQGAPEAAYLRGIEQLRSSGVVVVGYLRTQYAARPAEQVQADIDVYAARFGIDGVFLDEVSSQADKADYYTAVRRHLSARMPKGRLVLNPGTHLDVTYLRKDLCDTAIVFEDYSSKWPGYTPDAYVAQFKPARFGALMHGCRGVENMRLSVDLARERRFRYVFVTDRTMPNPWSALPSYWEAEVEHVASVNSRLGR